MGCKWSSLNSPGTETPQSHKYWKLGEFPFLISSPLVWGNKNGFRSIKVEKLEKFLSKMGLMGCKWSSLYTPGTPSCHSHPILGLGDSPFSIISPLG